MGKVVPSLNMFQLDNHYFIKDSKNDFCSEVGLCLLQFINKNDSTPLRLSLIHTKALQATDQLLRKPYKVRKLFVVVHYYNII